MRAVVSSLSGDVGQRRGQVAQPLGQMRADPVEDHRQQRQLVDRQVRGLEQQVAEVACGFRRCAVVSASSAVATVIG